MFYTVASFTDNSRGIIYGYNMFIVYAKGFGICIRLAEPGDNFTNNFCAKAGQLLGR
jgi:hypothetical protein